jgi:hypothetical protein
MEELSNSEKRAYGIEPVINKPISLFSRLLAGFIAISLLSALIVGGVYLFVCIIDTFGA